jgi:hypothetical protein
MIDSEYLDGGTYDAPSFYQQEDYLTDFGLTGALPQPAVDNALTENVYESATAAGIKVPDVFAPDKNKVDDTLRLDTGPAKAASPGLLGGLWDKADPFMKQALVMTLVGAVGSGLSAVMKGSSDEKLMDKKVEADQTLVQTQADIKKQQIADNQPGRIKRTEAATLLTPESWKTDPLKMTQSGIIDRQKGVPYGRTA